MRSTLDIYKFAPWKPHGDDCGTGGTGEVRPTPRRPPGTRRRPARLHRSPDDLRVSRRLRRDRRRRRPCRLRGLARRGAARRARARADRQPRDGRADVVQSGDRRRREGPPRQGARRARRRDGERRSTRPASSFAGSTRARARRCARRARRPTSGAIATRCGCGSSSSARLALRQGEVAKLHVEDVGDHGAASTSSASRRRWASRIARAR